MGRGPTWYGEHNARQIESDDDDSKLFKTNCVDCGAEITIRITPISKKHPEPDYDDDNRDRHKKIKQTLKVEIVKSTHMC